MTALYRVLTVHVPSASAASVVHDFFREKLAHHDGIRIVLSVRPFSVTIHAPKSAVPDVTAAGKTLSMGALYPEFFPLPDEYDHDPEAHVGHYRVLAPPMAYFTILTFNGTRAGWLRRPWPCPLP